MVLKFSVIHSNYKVCKLAMLLQLLITFVSVTFAGQGVQRMLYTVPNSSFIENPSSDSVVTINDTSGSIATLQALINNARSANPSSIIVIHLLNGATYSVSSAGLVLGSQECLVGISAIIQATNSSVTVPLITISAGSTNVSVAGGTLNGNGANTYGIYAPSSSARVNIDKVTVQNCGQDCIQLNGKGSSTFDNEMTVARCDVSGSPSHSGISIWNATQATCVDNNCHSNSVGIWMGSCGYCNIANNTCESNTTGIDFNSGNDNYIANNTCNNDGTGILLDGSSTMLVSDSLGGNTVAGINSSGSGNIYVDNLFTAGNATNFINGGSGDDVVAYKGSLSASDQNYFYPPLIDNQHNTTIVNGMGRYDLTDNSITTIDNVQSEYNAAISTHPGDVIVLHLNGTYTVGANPLTLASDTCVLLGGTIQINSSTTASCAVTATSGDSYISISGGTIDGGTASPPSTGRDAIYFSGIGMFQIDAVTMQHFGTNSTRVGGSDVVRIDHGSTPRIITRCTINGGSARGIWVATSGVRDVVSDNTVTDCQMDGVDCDESTSASLVKFNYLYNNGRYGVFLEQSASDNCVLGNICNYDASYDIGCYNNSTTPRGSTAYNSIICNSLLGDNGLRNGSTGTNVVTSSDNFFFDNTVMNANIQSQLYGSQNYYSQNYMGNSSLSTSGSEVFFNSADVNGNLQVQDSNSGLDLLVTNASASNGAAVITGSATGLGNDQWALIPTDSGYYRLMNENSDKAMVVLSASLNAGASIIQWTYDASGNDEWMPVSAGNGLYSFVNRLSGLYLDVTGASTTPGTQLDQQPSTGGANQQFNLVSVASPSLKWSGSVNGNWDTNTANWQGGSIYSQGDFVRFDDTLMGTPNVNLTTALSPGGIIVISNTAANYTFSGSGSLAGSAALVKQGPGTLTLGTLNSFSGGVTINGGTVQVAGGGGNSSLGGGNTVVNAGSTLIGTNGDAFGYAYGHNNPATIFINGGTVTDAGTSNYRITLPNITFTGGTLTSATGNNGDASGNYSFFGNSTNSMVTTLSNNTTAVISAKKISFQTGPTTFNVAAGNVTGGTYPGVDLVIFSVVTNFSSSNIQGINKTGAGVMAMDASNPFYSGAVTNSAGTLQLGAAGDTAALIEPLGSGTVLNNATLNFASGKGITVSNIISGTGALVVSSGSNVLTAANTYTGNTTVNAGTLGLNGSGSISDSPVISVAAGATLDASGRSDQTLTLASGQLLQGGGRINVNLTVGMGATVMPGASSNTPGTLTVAGAAQLQGTTFMKLNAPTGTNDQISAGSFVYGGTLTVTNLSGTLAAGQDFQLFTGISYSGSFSAINLPQLDNGLVWNTNNLATSGELQVISTAMPHITGIILSGTNVILGGTNGTAGEQYVLLSSTNVLLPVNQWTPMLTNTFAGGNFSVTNMINSNAPQNFYLLQIP